MIIDIIEMKIMVVKPLNKNFKLVSPSILFGDKINQFNSLLPQEAKGIIRIKNKFHILFIKN